MMSKYDPLSRWLRNQLSSPVKVTFEDIEDEDKIGVNLPPSARQYREWWANATDPKTRYRQCRAWLNAGWEVEYVDPSSEFVIFRKLGASS